MIYKKNKIAIKHSSFLGSYTYNKAFKKNNKTKYIVFIGRSNVGKSSLINSLARRKKMALISSVAGKTKDINIFKVDYTSSCSLLFADLPGLGYSKMSISKQAKTQKSISSFLLKEQLIEVFIHVIDARHNNLSIDVKICGFLNNIKRKNQHIFRVFNKIDKIKPSSLFIKKECENYFYVSNKSKKGIDNLNDAIYDTVFIEKSKG